MLTSRIAKLPPPLITFHGRCFEQVVLCRWLGVIVTDNLSRGQHNQLHQPESQGLSINIEGPLSES
jgi:hypothetical protein